MKSILKLEMLQSKLVFIIILFISFSCSEKEQDNKKVIALLNEREINVDEFRLFYELDPNFGIDSTGYMALLDELNKYIDMIVAKSKAESEGLLKDSIFTRAIEWEKRQANLRQLYRIEIDSSIEISDQELRKEYQNSNIDVNVRHLFTKDRQQINEWHKQLSNGGKFENLAQEAFNDTILKNNGGELGWINVRDLDDDFADEVLKLKKDEISTPIKTRWGFHILQLLDRKDTYIISDEDFILKRSSLYKRVKRKKSKKLSNQYIKNYIGKLNPQPNKNTFQLLWNAVVPANEHEKSKISFKINFTNEIIDNLFRKYSKLLELPLIEYKDGNIKLSEYLIALYKIPISNRPRFQSVNQLSNQIGMWVRDELLHKRAKYLNVDKHERVSQEVLKYTEEQCYYFYLQNEIKNISVPKSVNNYFEAPLKERKNFNNELNKFHTIEEWKWWKSERILHKKMMENSFTLKIDSTIFENENKRINWDRRIRLFMVRKPS